LFVFVKRVPQSLAFLEIEKVFGNPIDFYNIFPLAGPTLGINEDTIDRVFGNVSNSSSTLKST